ncbi:hypothetical protein K438DRAFT_1783809 [Mycena galopus ATCC 62051]|nr:hypothetical protein K438DRAFT_1783809 [Mycena galopus ATCC 62051]
MCDPLSTSCLLGALSLIPDNRYIFWVSAWPDSSFISSMGTVPPTRATLLASKIQTRMLEPRSVETWKEFAAYLQNSWKLCGTSHKRERPRQFSAGIQEGYLLVGACVQVNPNMSTQSKPFLFLQYRDSTFFGSRLSKTTVMVEHSF